MKRKLVAVVSVGALVFAVFVVDSGTVADQVNFLTDAGFAPPNRDATCPVRLAPDFATDAGLRTYQRLLFPVTLTVLSDGGRDIQMPPMPLQRVRRAIEVVDWNDCALAASTAPVRALAGTSRPFTTAGVVKSWCRAKLSASLPCLLTDGGTFGDRNVSACSLRANPATCERIGVGVIISGDNPETDIQ